MEVDFEQRIKPGIIFLNMLGYKLEMPKQFTQWEEISILNKNNNKIGHAYFSKDSLEIQGSEEKLKFVASYKLKNYHEENQINCYLDFNNYHCVINFKINFPILGNYERKINLQVFHGNYKEFEFNIPLLSNQVLLDSFDQIRGYEHVEFKEFNDSLGIFYEAKSGNAHKINKTIENRGQIITFTEEKYSYGVDISKRNYPLKKDDNIIKLLSYYMLKINNAYRVPFMELNNLSDGLLGQILAFALPQYDNKDIASIFGIHKHNINWQEEILNSPVRRLVK